RAARRGGGAGAPAVGRGLEHHAGPAGASACRGEKRRFLPHLHGSDGARLTHAARLSEAVIERILAYRLDERWGRRPENAIPELLLLLEFLARQGRRRSDPHVQRLFARLENARSRDGAFPPHLSARGWYPPEYTQVMVEYLCWWLGE
ncbi:MAG: hypothetical protein ACUVX9_16110, partial [Anaerolineae bacterium]